MKMKLHETKNDLHEKTRRAMIDLLNQELADVLDLGLQAKQAHWNVKGPHFIGLHELFDKVAEELEELTDYTTYAAQSVRCPPCSRGKGFKLHNCLNEILTRKADILI